MASATPVETAGEAAERMTTRETPERMSAGETTEGTTAAKTSMAGRGAKRPVKAMERTTAPHRKATRA